MIRGSSSWNHRERADSGRLPAPALRPPALGARRVALPGCGGVLGGVEREDSLPRRARGVGRGIREARQGLEAGQTRLPFPVVRGRRAAHLAGDVEHLRLCAAETCDWRWCDVSVCGNRDKARRFYRRARE